MSRSGRRLPYLLQRPEQGWFSLLLLLGMLVLLGLSIADARPLSLSGGSASLTDSLVVVLVAGGLVGYLLARSSIGVVRAHVLGAMVAAVMLLMVAGTALLPETSALPLGWADLTDRVEAVWERLDADVSAYLRQETVAPTMVTFLVFGAVCWATAQFSAFGVFRYERGGPAIMSIGALLFLNIGLESIRPDAELLSPLPVLAIFSSLAMLLLMRLQLVQQRTQWSRRHISDAGEVSRLFIRSGVVFVALTVVSATSLTALATVEAQEVDLGGLAEPLEDAGRELSRLLGIVGVPPPQAQPATREREWAVQDEWDEDRARGTAFSAQLQGQLRGNYWWGWADDHFDGRSWKTTLLDPDERAAGEPLPVELEAASGGPYRTRATIVVGDQGLSGRYAFRPAEASVFTDIAVGYNVIDEGGGIGDITFAEPLEEGAVVVVDSRVRDYSDDGASPTANELRAAGDGYPPWTDRYLQGEGDASINGPRVVAEASFIEGRTDTAYDGALLLQDRLRGMDYVTDMRGVCDGYLSTPECVLDVGKGFCQHYATTMAMVLREMGTPSRMVTGYLPGQLQNETWVVPQRAFHTWVEAYFPGHGWVRFDPTPGRRFRQAATDFADGPELGTEPAPTLQPTLPPDEAATFEPDPSLVPFVPEPEGGATGGGSAMLVLSVVGLVALVLTVISGLLLFRLRRLPDGDSGLAYRGIVSLATRLGYGPHPSQTEYEYAGSLAQTIPTVREELYVVTTARVESAYGQHDVEPERRGALRRAYARIRTALLRLSLKARR